MKLKELIMQAWEIAFLKQFTNFSPTEKHFICIIGKNYARLLIKKKTLTKSIIHIYMEIITLG